jgi:hypothetical protein
MRVRASQWTARTSGPGRLAGAARLRLERRSNGDKFLIYAVIVNGDAVTAMLFDSFGSDTTFWLSIFTPRK